MMKRPSTAAIAAIGLAVVLSGAAAAGQYEDGAAALMRGDYPTAIRLLEPLADQGDARAQGALAALPGSKWGPRPSPPAPITSPPGAPISSGSAAAGQYEDGTAALMRGDYPTAIRLLGPLADQGDARAQGALAGLPGSKWGPRPSPPPITSAPGGPILPLIVAIALVAGMGLVLGLHRRRFRTRQARIAKARVDLLASLSPEDRAAIDRARQLCEERSWEPITFGLESIETVPNGFRLRAAGVHRGHAFAFVIAFTMAYGPVAVCEWRRDGDASDALLDILAHYADVPRGERRFADLVKSSALIMSAEPAKVPFAQLRQLTAKVFFEFAEDNPEIYLKLDFASKTGTIEEKDPIYRRNLAHAFDA